MESAGVAEDGARVGEPGAAVGIGTRPAPREHVAHGWLRTARDYAALTKPRIIVLLLWTTLTTMYVADPSGPAASVVFWTLVGGYLAAGGAGAINHYLDRDRDARMQRTSTRPLPAGRISPARGLVFGIALGLVSIVLLAITVNVLTAALSLAGLVGYVVVYTVWLKPRTPQNIVIGGAAGAVPPLVGWAAATGSLSAEALIPFAIVFLWTPPHFWALSLMIKDDYAKTGVPMLPVVSGERTTRRQILAYTVVLVLASLLPVVTGLLGALYLAVAAALGIAFVGLAARLVLRPGERAALQLYLASLAYLALLFGAMATDSVLG